MEIRRSFNTTGLCSPKRHYMVRLDERVRLIREKYVDLGNYFVINRGRQYGKTTTLRALAEYLRKDYIVVSLDFQELDTDDFKDIPAFSRAFAKIFVDTFLEEDLEDGDKLIKPVADFIKETDDRSLRELFHRCSKLCKTASKPVILIIDEVDSASNNQVFIDFLALLRKYYLNRDSRATFHSVILAGVYDVKNLKLKIRPEEEHQYNSPWNIAADFVVSMSFSAKQIAGMLEEYEADYHTGMDIDTVSGYIYDYTSGYPYLVSAICKLLDENISEMEGFADKSAAWTREGIEEAVKIVLSEKIPLFDSMAKQLDTYPEMRDMIEEIVYQGKRIPFSMQAKPINLGVMFGYLKDEKGGIAIANRIFEMVLLNMFAAQEALSSTAFHYGERDKNQFTAGGRLNMELVLEKFVEHFHDIYGTDSERFIEENGRKFFLLYLKPIINGTGNYYIEARTRDARRTDVIVDYLGEQFIVELKIWHGNEYNERGERQLADYLDAYHKDKGYMLSFNFNQKKEVGVKEIRTGGKTIIEAVV